MTSRDVKSEARPAYNRAFLHVRAYVLLKYSFASSLYNSALAASSGVTDAGVTDVISPLPSSPIVAFVRRACLRACGSPSLVQLQPKIEVVQSHAVATCVTRDRIEVRETVLLPYPPPHHHTTTTVNDMKYAAFRPASRLIELLSIVPRARLTIVKRRNSDFAASFVYNYQGWVTR